MNLNKQKIIIIESGVSDQPTKIAKELKKKGYETIIISLVDIIEKDFVKESYDKFFSFNLKFFKINKKNIPSIISLCIKRMFRNMKILTEIRKINPNWVIVRTTPNWLYFFIKKVYINCPVIYFPTDIRSFGYKNIEEATSKGIPKFEILAEKWAFENADGIIHKGGEKELNNLNRQLLGDINLKCPKIYFFPYCLEEFMIPIGQKKISKEDKNIHLVYVGHVPIDEMWKNNLKKITKQKIYIHLYSKTINVSKEDEKKRVEKNCQDILENKFIILHEPVPQEKLAKEISKYDYGIYTVTNEISKSYEFATGNKIASYLEAGIPIICPSQFKTTANLLKRYKIGVIFNPFKIEDLKKELLKKSVEKFEKNIVIARKELSVKNNIPRMIKFLKDVERFYGKNTKRRMAELNNLYKSAKNTKKNEEKN